MAESSAARPGTPAGAERNWTTRLRDRLGRTVPPGQLLPSRQPVYVASWIYLFGVLSLAYFNVLNGSQMLLWHVTLLPLFVGMIVGLHLILVRRHGVVPPLDSERDPHAGAAPGFDPTGEGALP